MSCQVPLSCVLSSEDPYSEDLHFLSTLTVTATPPTSLVALGHTINLNVANDCRCVVLSVMKCMHDIPLTRANNSYVLQITPMFCAKAIVQNEIY